MYLFFSAFVTAVLQKFDEMFDSVSAIGFFSPCYRRFGAQPASSDAKRARMPPQEREAFAPGSFADGTRFRSGMPA